MEPKRLTVIVDKDDHLRAQKKMLDEFGEANFTKLIGDFLRDYIEGAGMAPSSSTSKKNVFDELMEVDPVAASDFVRLFRTLIKKAQEHEPPPPRIVEATTEVSGNRAAPRNTRKASNAT